MTTGQVKPRLGSAVLLSGPRTHLEPPVLPALTSLGSYSQGLPTRICHIAHCTPVCLADRTALIWHLAFQRGKRGPCLDQSCLCDAAAPPYPLTSWTRVATSGKRMGMDICLLIPVTSQSQKGVLPTSIDTSYLHVPLKFPQ